MPTNRSPCILFCIFLVWCLSVYPYICWYMFKISVQQNIISSRGFDVWNSIPESVVSIPSINAFKNRIDRCFLNIVDLTYVYSEFLFLKLFNSLLYVFIVYIYSLLRFQYALFLNDSDYFSFPSVNNIFFHLLTFINSF